MAEANLQSIGAARLNTVTSQLQSALDYTTLTHNVSTVNETWSLKSLTIANQANISGVDNQITVTFIPNGGTERTILKDAWVPYGTSLVAIHENISLYFQYGDEFRVYLDQGSNAEVTWAYQSLSEGSNAGGGGGGGGTAASDAFDPQNANTITVNLNSTNRTGNLFANGNLATGINYGTQNSAPFATTDLNQFITHVYAYGNYGSRTYAPAVPVLMERPPQGGVYPYGSNNWESAWWLDSVGNSSSDVLICVFDQPRSVGSFNVINSVDTYDNRAGDTVNFTKLVGSASSITYTALGNVPWSGTVTSQTLSVTGSNAIMQAFAVHRSGATGWSRLENIRILP